MWLLLVSAIDFIPAVLFVSTCSLGLCNGITFGPKKKGNTTKVHLINYEQVCKPKVVGGLGIKRST